MSEEKLTIRPAEYPEKNVFFVPESALERGLLLNL